METTPSGDEIFVVVALIQPFKLDSVALALEQIDSFRGMTVIECRGSVGDYAEGIGVPNGGTGAVHRRRAGEQGLVELASRVRLEIVVRGKAHATDIAETIARVAHTGRAGDGFVSTALLASLIRIRTMETGVDGI
jgi:nitrogen regulatory protein PII